MRVDELIHNIGDTVQLKSLVQDQSAFDELRGEWNGEKNFQTIQVRAYVRPLKALERQTVPGLENEEAVVFILTQPVKPGDVIELEGREYEIVQVSKTFFWGKVLYYRAIGKRST